MKKIMISIMALFLIQSIYAQEIIWLSNTPPASMKDNVRASGMHRLSALKKGDTKKKKVYKTNADSTKKFKRKKKKSSYSSYGAVTNYVQWIRKGNSIQKPAYICIDDSTDYQLKLISPTGNEEKIELVKSKNCYLKFELNEEGYYNAYLIIKKAIGDTLYINIAKAELLSHSCRNGHHKKLEARPVMHYPEITEFEIIRERHPWEDFHYFSSSGEKESYKAFYKDKVAENVKITLYTEKGWSKTMHTDKNGKVNVQFLQDYFSKWQELNKRKIHYYMLAAEYTVQDTNEYKGKTYPYVHYTLTMSDGYRPARTMYTSMVWGLIVFLTVTIVSIAGIFIYKERRKKPYKELKFDEH
ncbi:MAG: hypothetical protein L3J74_13890 [Bacteroidales bacterium]|nr:hypothetical protein [Bacteroidales bacterium]